MEAVDKSLRRSTNSRKKNNRPLAIVTAVAVASSSSSCYSLYSSTLSLTLSSSLRFFRSLRRFQVFVFFCFNLVWAL
ncbi:hypothetical protein VNO80_18826 [Phaseolus coccineus]|uniref:Transmembrane protein n=1 Tax=Phaseolus coccineus TaxID=3886 RepID=A0AAN9MEV1_PHACN